MSSQWILSISDFYCLTLLSLRRVVVGNNNGCIPSSDETQRQEWMSLYRGWWSRSEEFLEGGEWKDKWCHYRKLSTLRPGSVRYFSVYMESRCLPYFNSVYLAALGVAKIGSDNFLTPPVSITKFHKLRECPTTVSIDGNSILMTITPTIKQLHDVSGPRDFARNGKGAPFEIKRITVWLDPPESYEAAGSLSFMYSIADIRTYVKSKGRHYR